MLSPTAHFYLTHVIALVLSGGVVWVTILRSSGLNEWLALVLLPCTYLGTVWIFNNIIPAKCPKCGKATYHQKTEMWDTYKYKCRICSHVADTEIMAEPPD